MDALLRDQESNGAFAPAPYGSEVGGILRAWLLFGFPDDAPF
jgi:hypothetical protein